MTNHKEVLEEIQASVKFYEADKPEFVEALDYAIQVLERVEGIEGIENNQ